MNYNLVCIFKVAPSGNKYYCIVEYDSTVTQFRRMVLSLDEVQAVLQRDGRYCDFSITDGVFRCNPEVVELNVTQKHVDEYRNDSTVYWDEESLYGLLASGIHGNFLILDSEPEPDQVFCGMDGIATFSSVRFSEGTMSIYVPMHEGNALHNKMIVKMEDGNLGFSPFYFAVPATECIPYQCIDVGKSISINSTIYRVALADKLKIYDSSAAIFDGVINYCAYKGRMLNDAIKTLRLCISSGDSGIVWSGGTGGYKSPFGVYFKSSYQPMNEQQRFELLNRAKTVSQESAEATPGYSIGGKYAVRLLRVAGGSSNDEESMLAKLYDFIGEMRNGEFWASMYLYRVRVRAYLERYAFPRSYLVGGCTREFTVINKQYKSNGFEQLNSF